jgi:hypothetical protein
MKKLKSGIKLNQWDALTDIASDQYDVINRISGIEFEFETSAGMVRLWYDPVYLIVYGNPDHIEYLEDLILGATETGEWDA